MDCQNRQEFCLVSGTFAVGNRDFKGLRRRLEESTETRVHAAEPQHAAAPTGQV